MRIRALRREHVRIVLAALCLGAVLVGVNVAWPAAFGVCVAIGGFVGALMVFYEVRLTKRIAQAEFIRDLQTGFSSDGNISELWKKLLLKEPITPSDRHMVSSYLTFFETLHLLLSRHALELSLTDDLFRNRFFTAIGDQGILDTALISHAGAFANIHRLIATWHQYLLDHGIPIHDGYYSYIQAITEAKGFKVERLTTPDAARLVALQQEVLDSLPEREWLRANSEDMLQECVDDHTALGAWKEGRLVAAAVLYDGGSTEENIRRYFSNDHSDLIGSVNLKLVLSLPEFRREGLARTLVELLEQQAAGDGRERIMCTIHPSNSPSRALFERLGYVRVGRVETKYGRREVFERKLPSRLAHWAR